LPALNWTAPPNAERTLILPRLPVGNGKLPLTADEEPPSDLTEAMR
jgi:hypothetical protein